jgi:tungstate transport system permease protein
MVMAQVVIATPVVAGVSMAAFQQLPERFWWELAALAPPAHLRAILVGREALPGLLAAGMAGFGSVISEVGASLMVGGNIHGRTQVLTTATVEAVRKGEFGVALGFSAVLLGLVLGVAALLTLLQQGRRA